MDRREIDAGADQRCERDDCVKPITVRRLAIEADRPTRSGSVVAEFAE
jgi:hypothetical protein